MSLDSIHDMMRRAQEERYAIGYFEGWNLESIEGVIDAAEQTRSPIIIGFNGDFMSHDGRRAASRLSVWAAMAKAAAESSAVPCGLVFNECSKIAWLEEAIDRGFNLVLPVDESWSPDEYVRRLKELVSYAHQRNAAVEAELGELPCAASGSVDGNGALTDPVTAGRFVRETGVDLLSVSVGNVHIQVNGERSQKLDLERLRAIRDHVPVPLVLHGGTGIAEQSLKDAIQLGVAKINYGTYLKQRYLAAVRKALSRDLSNPHELLGLGGEPDVMVIGRLAVRDAVLERIESLGCCGKAKLARPKVPPPSRQFDRELMSKTD